MDSLDWAVWANLSGWTPPPRLPDKGMKALPWDEMKTKFAPRLLLDPETWKPDVLDIGASLQPAPVTEPGVTFGDWGYHLIRYKKHDAFDLYQGANRGVNYGGADGDPHLREMRRSGLLKTWAWGESAYKKSY